MKVTLWSYSIVIIQQIMLAFYVWLSTFIPVKSAKIFLP